MNLGLLANKFEELIIPMLEKKQREESNDEHKTKRFIDTTKTMFKHIVNNPTMKIWEEMKAFKMECGVQQGGICSPLLFILLVDKFALITEKQNTSSRKSSTAYNWADDINSVTNDILALKNIIREQRKASEELQLPFSATKT